MSKTIKGMIIREYQSRLTGTSEALLISVRGVRGIPGTKLRKDLAKKNIKITVVRNALARNVLKGGPLEKLEKFLTGSSAIAIGKDKSVVEVAREIIAAVEKLPKVELKGAILDGIIFKGKAGVEELSKFPTKDEAIGRVVTLIVSPARKLVGQIQGPGCTVAGLIKSIESKLEKGEAIAAKA